MRTWATYARLSREDDGGRGGISDSCKVQTENATAFANGRGATTALSFADDGFSGASLDRPGLVAMLAAAKARRFQNLALRDLDRLSRDQGATHYLLFELRRAGVEVYTYKDGKRVETEGIAGVMVSLQAFANETERQKARERTREALRDRAARGFASGPVPLGYKIVLVGDGSERKNIAIDEAKAEIVRDIAQRFITCGGVFSRVCRSLNADGVRTSKGKAWTAGRVRETLANPLYRGIKTHGARGQTHVAGVAKMIVQPEDTVIRIDVPHLRIFDKGLTAKVDKLLAEERPVQWGGAATPKYLASRFVTCGFCGSSVCAADARYRCRLRHQSGAHACVGIGGRPAVEVDEALIAAAAPYLEGRIAERALAELKRRLVAEARGEDRAALREKLEAQLAKASARASTLGDELADGNRSPTLKAKLAEEERRAAEARTALESLDATAPTRLDVRRTLEAARTRLADMKALLREGGVAARPVFEALLGGARLVARPVNVRGQRRWELTGRIADGYVLAPDAPQRCAAALR